MLRLITFLLSMDTFWSRDEFDILFPYVRQVYVWRFLCLKFAYCSSRHYSYCTHCCVSIAIDRYSQLCVYRVLYFWQVAKMCQLKTRQCIMYPATLATVSNVLYPFPPLHTRFIGQVAAKVESTITGQTARAISSPLKPGLKAVPPTF